MNEWYALLRRAVKARKLYDALTGYGSLPSVEAWEMVSDLEYEAGDFLEDLPEMVQARDEDGIEAELDSLESVLENWRGAVIIATALWGEDVLPAREMTRQEWLAMDKLVFGENNPEVYKRNALLLGQDAPRPYRDQFNLWPLSWNIKLNCFETNGRQHRSGATIAEHGQLDPDLDWEWEAYLEKAPDVFWWACANALEDLLEGHFFAGMADAELDKVLAKFRQAGRCGGNLILTEFAGYKLKGGLGPLIGMGPSDLDLLWRACAEVSRAVTGREKQIEIEYHWHRLSWEEDRNA